MRLLILYSLCNYPTSRMFWCFFSDGRRGRPSVGWGEQRSSQSAALVQLFWTGPPVRSSVSALCRLKDGCACVYGICICTYRYTWAYKYVIDSTHIYIYIVTVLHCIVFYYSLLYYMSLCYIYTHIFSYYFVLFYVVLCYIFLYYTIS